MMQRGRYLGLSEEVRERDEVAVNVSDDVWQENNLRKHPRDAVVGTRTFFAVTPFVPGLLLSTHPLILQRVV